LDTFARYVFTLICKTYKQKCLHRKWPCGNRMLSSSGREDRRRFSALLLHVLLVVLALETLTSFLAPGGTVWWGAQVDVTLEDVTGIFFGFPDFHVMVSRQYQRWKLKFSLKLQGWLFIFFIPSTHLDKPGSGPYILTPPPSRRICNIISRIQFSNESFLSVPYTSLSLLLLFVSIVIFHPF